ncbi:MAG TPA: site-2 protease family protein, partial [Candidatus Ornithomonoglobus intestinigallinarum]|nr:site-2 protease family protein [Candidatus Ornithomonoglobus intestinigallinarum]
DEIVELNGKHIDFYNDITLYRSEMSPDKENIVTIKRNGEKLDVPVMLSEQKTTVRYNEDYIEYTTEINGFPEISRIEYSEDVPKDESLVGTEDSATQYIIGFSPTSEEITFGNIWGYAWSETKFVVKLVYKSLWGLVTGEVGMDQMSGPVGIVTAINDAVTQETDRWLYVFNLAAILTINLGIFNLLPLPALDGGRLLFMIIEFVRRKPIPPEKEGMVHAIGMLLLFAFVIFVSFNDIMRLFGR